MKKTNFILKILSAVIKGLRGLKIKSKCCNSECVNNNKIIECPQQPPQEQG